MQTDRIDVLYHLARPFIFHRHPLISELFFPQRHLNTDYSDQETFRSLCCCITKASFASVPARAFLWHAKLGSIHVSEEQVIRVGLIAPD